MTDETIDTAPVTRTLPKAPPDGIVAAILLAFLATAGLFYVNIMAAIVDGLVDGMGLSDREAGNIGSANIYGAAVGAFIAVFIVKRLPWRPLAIAFLFGLIAIDLASIFIKSGDVLLVVRLIHGLVGGLLVGVGFAVIARTKSPDRTFGMLLFVQFGLGGLGVMTLPQLVPIYGTQALFIALAAFSVVTLALVPFLSAYPPSQQSSQTGASGINWLQLVLTLIAILLFQAANMALLAYIIRLGIDYGLERTYVSTALGLATWVALAGPLLVTAIGVKYGRFPILLGAMALTLVGTAIFHWSQDPVAYMVANCGTGVVWGLVMAYLLAMTAEFDQAGRTAAFGGFISKIGLASGPVVAGLLLDNGYGFSTLINVALIGLALSAAVMLIPALSLDRARRRSTVS